MRKAVHLNLNRDRNLLLDFFCSPPRPLGDDLNVVVRHVGIRFDRQIMKRDAAPDQKEYSDGDDDYFIAQGEINDEPDH